MKYALLLLSTFALVGCAREKPPEKVNYPTGFQAQCDLTSNDTHGKEWRGKIQLSKDAAERDKRAHDNAFHKGLNAAQVVKVRAD